MNSFWNFCKFFLKEAFYLNDYFRMPNILFFLLFLLSSLVLFCPFLCLNITRPSLTGPWEQRRNRLKSKCRIYVPLIASSITNFDVIINFTHPPRKKKQIYLYILYIVERTNTPWLHFCDLYFYVHDVKAVFKNFRNRCMYVKPQKCWNVKWL